MAREVRPLVFLGTPDAAATVLQRLLEANFAVAHVITRDDARRGRGASTSPSPVKKLALAEGIEVSHSLEWVNAHADEKHLGIVVAYGRLIPAAVLAHTPMINVHFSLLPRWRGAAPVERALLAGDSKTGICIMDLEETLDTGPIHRCAEIDIRSSHTTPVLTRELAELGAKTLVDLLNEGFTTPVPQHGEATYAAKISRDELRIDWSTSAVDIERHIRALRMYTTLNNSRIRILEASVNNHGGNISPGLCDNQGMVGTGDGLLQLVTVQPEGKKPMDVADWLRGRGGHVAQFDLSA